MRLIVIGGGAAGFFCAVNAARINPALEVVLIEKSAKVLSKVRVSGGGRCNVTHACFEMADMVKNYPRGQKFIRKAFYEFFTTDTIRWFEERGVRLKTEADGRMFPETDSSETIINCLLKDVNKHRVEMKLHRELKSLTQLSNRWKLSFQDGSEDEADYVCLACGGYPKESMFEWIKSLGHSVAAPVPSLFTFNMPGNPIRDLMGVSVASATIKVKGSKLSTSGPVLITHWGMSGPAILKLSAWGAREFSVAGYNFKIVVNWLPQHHENSLREEFQSIRFDIATQAVAGRNPFQLPQRLWEFLVSLAGIPIHMRWADLPADKSNNLVRTLTSYEAEVKGKTTYKEEFVTAGGVHLSEVNPLTMESKLQPNLFFAGEILDVDGVTGGFNFQHAWTSGYIAANSIAIRSLAGGIS